MSLSRREFLATALAAGLVPAGTLRAGEEREQGGRRLRVWLRQLEKSIRGHIERGEPLNERQKFLAGLLAVEHVFVVGDDIVLEGPGASEWTVHGGHTAFDRLTGRPLVTLDDFVVALRNAYFSPEPPTLSLEPRASALQAVKDVLRTATAPRNEEELRALERRIQSVWGEQDAVLIGVPRQTRFALVMAYADWEMKRYSLGLSGVKVAEVTPYVELEFRDHVDEVRRKGAAVPLPATGSRFWFVATEDRIKADDELAAFELPSQLVRLVTESYYRLQAGERKVTPTTPAAREFAESFSSNFSLLERHFPVFHDLHNLFRLVAVAKLFTEYGLPERINWDMDFLLTQYEPAPVHAPRTLPGLVAVRRDTVRLANRRGQANIVFPAWGGVRVAPSSELASRT